MWSIDLVSTKMLMEGQLRVSAEGADGLSNANDQALIYVDCIHLLKKLKSALAQAFNTTRAYPDLLCQISHVVFMCLQVSMFREPLTTYQTAPLPFQYSPFGHCHE